MSPPIQMTDIGANLTHDSFDVDRDEVVKRARNLGIEMIITGADLEGSQRAITLAERYHCRSTAGIHPHHAGTADDSAFHRISELAGDPRVCAVGETGLDYFRDFSPRDAQRASFEAHLDIAAYNGLPMFLHERDASDDFIKILERHRPRLGNIVVHCFTGSAGALAAYIDLDCHIGITGWLADERRGQHLIPLIKTIPTHRLMIETDAPYLLPRNMIPRPKDRRNEPANLPWVCKAVAEAIDETQDEVASRTHLNAQHFFGLS